MSTDHLPLVPTFRPWWAVVRELPTSAGTGFVAGFIGTAVLSAVIDTVTGEESSYTTEEGTTLPPWVWPTMFVVATVVGAAVLAIRYRQRRDKVETERHRILALHERARALSDSDTQRAAESALFSRFRGTAPDLSVVGVIYANDTVRPAVLVCDQYLVGWACLDVPPGTGEQGVDWDADMFATHENYLYANRPIRPGTNENFAELLMSVRAKFSLRDKVLRPVPPEEGVDELARVLALAGQSLHELWDDDEVPYPAHLGGAEQPGTRLVRDHHDAEELAAEWVRYLGWPDARRTVASGDGGIDVLGAGVAAQVKFEALKTGRPALQNLFGAASGEGIVDTIFVCSAGYTAGALEWADRVDMALFQFSLDGGLDAVNTTARDLLRKARS